MWDSLLRYPPETETLEVEAPLAEYLQIIEQLCEALADRTQDEKNWRISERRFRLMAQAAAEALILVDEQERIIFWNKSAQQMFGYTEAEIVGRTLSELLPQQQHAAHKQGLARLRTIHQAHPPSERLEMVGLRKDGSEFPLHLALTAWHLDETVFFSGMLYDLTPRRAAEQALLERASAWERALVLERDNHALEQFAYAVSHDLQEPLRKIQTYGQRLQTKCGLNLNTKGQDYLTRILGAAGHMQRLIDDLLAYSRVTTHPRPFTRVDLNQVVREALADLEVRLELTRGQVALEPLPVIEADATQMRQLFQNLISNALKFHKPTEPPQVQISARIIPDDTEQQRPLCCQIQVADNGIGFDEKYLGQIFKVFQRLHGRDEYEGTGVGLAICQRIVERHEGSITASSQPNAGATFIITLPMQQYNHPPLIL